MNFPYYIAHLKNYPITNTFLYFLNIFKNNIKLKIETLYFFQKFKNYKLACL